ncbi:AraC family transcriptional regulator [Nocardia ninae]|uniref:Transcriptional regulator n=1 Tax=Nocardia ninae NBRC 108245 TaxID=1210091 RepID=A0A511MK08_9NOCA|nr:AraC family transcriptional regulator [Nocardia ninae]GEM40972.1 transcriptional regulator [Nocardia ninae NBRC 108245]
MAEELATLRSTTSVALLAEYAMRRGLPRSVILRDTGIKEGQLDDPAGEITLGQELALMSNLTAAIDDEPGQGFMAGLLCHPPSFGVLGFALMTSPNLRHALEIGLRYVDLSFTAARLDVCDHGAEVWITRDDRALPVHIRRFALERDLAAISTIQQDLLSTRIPVTRVEVPYEPHPIYETFAAMLGVEKVVYGASGTTLVVQSSALQLPLPQANIATARFYEQQCAELIDRRRSRMGISKQVRQLLLRQGTLADQARVAAALNLSVRTLRRRLAEEGTTFRELSNETLGLLAEELLMAGLTVENVADRLGYASPSAFTTAFRGWRGLSPGNFARVKRGLAPVGA